MPWRSIEVAVRLSSTWKISAQWKQNIRKDRMLSICKFKRKISFMLHQISKLNSRPRESEWIGLPNSSNPLTMMSASIMASVTEFLLMIKYLPMIKSVIIFEVELSQFKAYFERSFDDVCKNHGIKNRSFAEK
jgi:hypothetical protein